MRTNTGHRTTDAIMWDPKEKKATFTAVKTVMWITELYAVAVAVAVAVPIWFRFMRSHSTPVTVWWQTMRHLLLLAPRFCYWIWRLFSKICNKATSGVSDHMQKQQGSLNWNCLNIRLTWLFLGEQFEEMLANLLQKDSYTLNDFAAHLKVT